MPAVDLDASAVFLKVKLRVKSILTNRPTLNSL